MPCRGPYSHEEENLQNLARVLFDIHLRIGVIPWDSSPSIDKIREWMEFKGFENVRQNLDDNTRELCHFCKTLTAEMSERLDLPPDFQTVKFGQLKRPNDLLVIWWAHHRYQDRAREVLAEKERELELALGPADKFYDSDAQSEYGTRAGKYVISYCFAKQSVEIHFFYKSDKDLTVIYERQGVDITIHMAQKCAQKAIGLFKSDQDFSEMCEHRFTLSVAI